MQWHRIADGGMFGRSPLDTCALLVTNPLISWVGHFGLPVHFFAPPEFHGRFKCCPDSHNISAILSTRLAMFRTSATFTATAFPLPCHFLCTSPILSPAFLPHLPFPLHIRICFPNCVGSFAALTRGLSAFHSSLCTSKGIFGIASFCTFQRAQSTPICFFPLFVARAPSENSTQVRTHNRINSVRTLPSLLPRHISCSVASFSTPKCFGTM
jgi:hypothetical protein